MLSVDVVTLSKVKNIIDKKFETLNDKYFQEQCRTTIGALLSEFKKSIIFKNESNKLKLDILSRIC